MEPQLEVGSCSSLQASLSWESSNQMVCHSFFEQTILYLHGNAYARNITPSEVKLNIFWEHVFSCYPSHYGWDGEKEHIFFSIRYKKVNKKRHFPSF